jgi:hypothetical protein
MFKRGEGCAFPLKPRIADLDRISAAVALVQIQAAGAYPIHGGVF